MDNYSLGININLPHPCSFGESYALKYNTIIRLMKESLKMNSVRISMVKRYECNAPTFQRDGILYMFETCTFYKSFLIESCYVK